MMSACATSLEVRVIDAFLGRDASSIRPTSFFTKTMGPVSLAASGCGRSGHDQPLMWPFGAARQLRRQCDSVKAPLTNLGQPARRPGRRSEKGRDDGSLSPVADACGRALRHGLMPASGLL